MTIKTDLFFLIVWEYWSKNLLDELPGGDPPIFKNTKYLVATPRNVEPM